MANQIHTYKPCSKCGKEVDVLYCDECLPKGRDEWLRYKIRQLGFTVDFCEHDGSFSIYDRGYILLSFYGCMGKLNMFDSHISFKDFKEISLIAEEYQRRVEEYENNK